MLLCARLIVLAMHRPDIHRAWPRVLKRDTVRGKVLQLVAHTSGHRFGVQALAHDIAPVSPKHLNEIDGPPFL